VSVVGVAAVVQVLLVAVVVVRFATSIISAQLQRLAYL
jgi:hypothetical protein